MSERRDPGGGGLTGATGDLTPDESDEPFVPAERREQEGQHGRGSVTYRQGVAAPAQRGEIGEPEADDTGGPTNLATRESGYGSEHGLAPNDPAYRMEIDPPAPSPQEEVTPDERAAGEPRQPRQGVDEVADHEERF